jgi:O-antigen/teichoic acid export membrane protein
VEPAFRKQIVSAGAARLAGQVGSFILRFCSLVIFARLLTPEDFGVVGMVIAVTGVYELFVWGGLSSATIQRESISQQQASLLFWVSALIGAGIVVSSFAVGPLLSLFYGDARLTVVTVVVACGLGIAATNCQHSALMHREMRYGALTVIDLISIVAGAAVGIVLAVLDFGYWALVSNIVAAHLVGTIALWCFVGWRPSVPRWNPGDGSLIHFGASLTGTALITYIATNADKVMIGRIWGAEHLGYYGRAQQLIALGPMILQSAIGPIAFSSLSRVGADPARRRELFLQFLAVTTILIFPLLAFCVVYAHQIVTTVLGPHWEASVRIFQYLAPAIIASSLTSPVIWYLTALGQHRSILTLAVVSVPIIMMAYAVGIAYGPVGVAVSYSIATLLLVLPQLMWYLKGTEFSLWDIGAVIIGPVISSVCAVLLAHMVTDVWLQLHKPVATIVVGGLVATATYVFLLYCITSFSATYSFVLKPFWAFGSE